MPVIRQPRPPAKDTEVREKGASARQLQMFIGMKHSKQDMDFNLVAEPRYGVKCCFICLLLTMFSTILAITTATDGEQFASGETLFSTTLATTTTIIQFDATTAAVSRPDDSWKLAGFEQLTDSSTSTLALPTTTTRVDESKVMDLVNRIFDKSQLYAQSAMDKMDRLHQSVTDELKPSEVLKRLHELGLLDDDEVREFRALELVERKSTINVTSVVPVAEQMADGVQHDPWWYDGVETHGEPEVVSTPGSFHGTLSSAVYNPGYIDNSSVWNVTDEMDIHGRFLQKVIGRMLQSYDVTLTDVGQLSSMLIPEKKRLSDVRATHWSLKHKLNVVMILAGSSLILSAVCMMQHQNQRFGHRMPQGSPYQQDVGAATLKTPPAWSYENAAQYTLRSWLSDVLMWSSATDVEVERQGPAVALQITGVARDLIREINPQHLRDGIHENGVHIPGIMLLCRTLANHFAPLESELQTRAMAELMNFARMGHETIDVSLTRFEVLRHRAAQRGGLMMNTTTLSYLLLNGLRLRPEQWERALMPLDGQLPHDDAAFQQLFDRLRRIGRMHEGHFNPPHKQGATGDVGYHFFPTFDNPRPMPGTGFEMDYATYYGGNRYNPPNDAQNEQSPYMPDVPSSSGLHGSQSFASVPITEEEEQCTRCGMYYEDEFSSGTESDDGEADSEASQIYAQFEGDPSMLGNVLFGDYMLAKQRWRRFAGRLPRRYRRGHFNRFRQRNNFNKSQKYGKAYSSFLPPNAFAAHRGPGGKGKGGKGGGSKQNPRGKDGKIMTCHKCGSTEHLLRRCPKNDSSGPASGSLAMISSGTNLQFYAGALGGEFGRLKASSNSTDSFKRAGSVMDDLESLRSIASSRRRTDDASSLPQEAKSSEDVKPPDYSENPTPRFPPPDMPAPSLHEIQTKTVQTTTATSAWTSFTTGVPSVLPSGSSVLNPIAGLSNPTAWMSFGYGSKGFGSSSSPQARIADESAQADSQPSEQDALTSKASSLKRRKADDPVRQATTLQLTSLLQGMSGGLSQNSSGSFPWWETATDTTSSETMPPPPYISARNFHTMTCLDDGTIGLLVDPGAHDNLAGSRTFEHLGNQIGARINHRLLDMPLNVSGVGKESQQARKAMTVDFQLMGQNDEVIQASYCAPVIENSSLPPLLGLKSLTAKRALLDMHSRLLIFPGQGGVEVKCSPGTQLFQLEMSQSGHLLLPIRRLPPRARSEPSRSTMPGPRLDFPMKIRRIRSMSPDRRVGVHRDATTPTPSIPDSMREQTIMTGRRERTPPRGHRAEDVRVVDNRSESSSPMSPAAALRMFDRMPGGRRAPDSPESPND